MSAHEASGSTSLVELQPVAEPAHKQQQQQSSGLHLPRLDLPKFKFGIAKSPEDYISLFVSKHHHVHGAQAAAAGPDTTPKVAAVDCTVFFFSFSSTR